MTPTGGFSRVSAFGQEYSRNLSSSFAFRVGSIGKSLPVVCLACSSKWCVTELVKRRVPVFLAVDQGPLRCCLDICRRSIASDVNDLILPRTGTHQGRPDARSSH